MKHNKILVYGATGYTGKLICERLQALNLPFAIAGRNKESVSALASELGVSYFLFETHDHTAWKEALTSITCLINAAGPFTLTAKDAMQACILHNVHYLDISAELPTYQLAESMDELAKNAGIMLISGAGLFVPYDALVVHTAKRVQNPQQLAVGFRHFGGFSKGSIKSAQYIADLGMLVRENGVLQQASDSNPKSFDFGNGAEECLPTPLGGIIHAYKSSRIPNIREYFQIKLPALTAESVGIDVLPDGPTAEERAAGRNKLAVEITGTDSKSAYSIADMPSGYTLTALAVVAVANRVYNGDFKIGYQSPGSAYGDSIIYDIPDVHVIDLY